jgi:hypothetical protein
MNGVPHSAHVISRSDIAVVLLERALRNFTLYAFGALALRFFQPPGCGTKALVVFKRNAKTAGVPTGYLRRVYSSGRDLNKKSVAEHLQQTFCLWHMRHSRLKKTSIFTGNIGC